MGPRLQIPVLALTFLILAADAFAADGGKDVSDTGDWRKPYLEMQVDGVGGGSHGGYRAGFDFLLSGGADGFHVAVVAPVRFGPDGIRDQEWDEVNDFGRLLDRFGYRDRTGDIDVSVIRVLDFTLGHGNLVSMFDGTVDTDHWRTGLSARLHWGVAGGDAFIDSITGPAVFGARAYFRPLWFVDRNGQVGRLEIGASFATDIFAPGTIGSGTAGEPSAVLPDSRGLVASNGDAVYGWSVDASWPVRASERFEIRPWAAWSRIGQGDAGHIGVDLAARLAHDVELSVSGGYAYMESGFAAGYFDDMYMADRYDCAVWRDTIPGAVSKQALLESPGQDRHGGSAGFMVRWEPWIAAWMMVDIDQRGFFSRVRTGLTVTVPDRLILSASVYARGFGLDNSDGAADRIHAAVAADVTLWKFIGVFASYARDVYVPQSGVQIGRYVGGNTALAGLRFSFGLLRDR